MDLNRDSDQHQKNERFVSNTTAQRY